MLREKFSVLNITQLQWQAINPSKKAKKKSYKNSGTIHLDSFKVHCVDMCTCTSTAQ